MKKLENGKHCQSLGKHFLLHHSGKWSQVAVRFPRSIARLDRTFDRPFVFLVPLSTGPILRAGTIDGVLTVSGSRLIRMMFSAYLRDGMQMYWNQQLADLRQLEVPLGAIERERALFNDLRLAMRNLLGTIIRRKNELSQQTEH